MPRVKLEEAERRRRAYANHAKFRASPRGRYWHQKLRARERGIPWELTFDQWWKIWQESGHWDERGKGRFQYVMGRLGDRGAYAEGNVEIVTFAENTSQISANRWRNERAEAEPCLDVEAL